MSNIKKYDNKPVKPGFENLRIWKSAYELMLRIHEICKLLPKEERFQLKDQIERSSSSVPDNIAEGYSAYYFKERIKSFYVARREATETQNHLRKMSGKNYVGEEISDGLILEYEGLIRGINAYIRYLREKSRQREF